MNSFRFLSSLLDASGKTLLRELGFGYMLSPMVAYTSRIIMQAIPARVIAATWLAPLAGDFFFPFLPGPALPAAADAYEPIATCWFGVGAATRGSWSPGVNDKRGGYFSALNASASQELGNLLA